MLQHSNFHSLARHYNSLRGLKFSVYYDYILDALIIETDVGSLYDLEKPPALEGFPRSTDMF